jgi:hypothetical protein
VKRTVLGGVKDGSKTLQLVDDPNGMDEALRPEFVRLEVTDGCMDLSLAQIRRFKEALAHAERVLVARQSCAFLERNLQLPL